MEIVFIIFFLFILSGFVIIPTMMILALILGKKSKTNLKTERQAYENMINSTNDITVAEYIKVFQSTQNGFIGKLHNLSGEISIENNMRISQGYTEVANSPNVSPELKEQLTMLLLSKGIIIG